MARVRHFYTLILAFFGLGAAIEVHESMEAQELVCPVPIPSEPTAQACHDKPPALQDRPEEPQNSGGPLQAANAIRQIMATSAQFPTAYEETFIKPWRGNLLITTPAGNDANQKDLKREPLEPPEPPHYESPQELIPATVAVDDGARLSDWFGPSLAGPRPNFRAKLLGRT